MLDRTKLQPPFYANIFSYVPSQTREGYAAADEATLREVQHIPGFLGYEVTGSDTRRIFISYWRDMDAIDAWRKNHTHQNAKSHGKEWYSAYHSMLVRVESHSMWQPELLV
jgi:heme-degrading monooxygenase HmoA